MSNEAVVGTFLFAAIWLVAGWGALQLVKAKYGPAPDFTFALLVVLLWPVCLLLEIFHSK